MMSSPQLAGLPGPFFRGKKGVDIRGERDDTAIVEFGVLSQHLE